MLIRSIAFAGILAVSGVFAAQPTSARIVALRAARVLDPASGRITPNGVIVVKGDRIDSVATASPTGAELIDLGNVTLMPGLIDGHTHVLLQPDDEVTPPVLYKSQAYRTIEGVRAVRLDLEAGFTTLRDLDSDAVGLRP